MAVRLLDVFLSTIALLVLAPLIGIAAFGILLSSPGPVFFRQKRTGLEGTTFVVYKLRTMHIAKPDNNKCITAKDDPRVFWFGGVLRRLKIDELPQLFNIMKGDMSIVGPRPEEPAIVNNYYTKEDLETLSVKPGLASPGSIYNFTHGEVLLVGDDVEKIYREKLLPLKLALDRVYVQRKSLLYDFRIIIRTVWVVAGAALGRRHFRDPSEMPRARALLEHSPIGTSMTVAGVDQHPGSHRPTGS